MTRKQEQRSSEQIQTDLSVGNKNTMSPSQEKSIEASVVRSRQSLSREELRLLDAYWRASNYLSVGQIYLLDNPLLKQPLLRQHIKPRLLGHWGTSPGLNMLYTHLNRVIRREDLNMIYVIGPGHGGPSLVAHGYKEEGTTTTPFDMVVLNDLDRFHLCEDVIDRLPQLGARADHFKHAIDEKLIEHRQYIRQHGDDMPEISGWRWGSLGRAQAHSTGHNPTMTKTSTESDNL